MTSAITVALIAIILMVLGNTVILVRSFDDIEKRIEWIERTLKNLVGEEAGE